MIIGLGIDVVKISRIERAVQRFDKRFLYRVYCSKEIEHCMKKKNPYPSLAGRFAVKEAFVKAIGTGFRNGIRLKQICTLNDKLGAPVVKLLDQAERYFFERGCKEIFVSISHEKDVAVAVVILGG